MSLYRTKSWLVLWVLLCLAVAPAHAQGVRDLQLFAPAETDQFGEGIRADEGAFFSIEGLYWWISPPETEEIGEPGLYRIAWLRPAFETGFNIVDLDPLTVTQHNSHDTSELSSEAVGGSRFEFGYVRGHDGIIFSILKLQDQNQRLTYGQSDVMFDDKYDEKADHGLLAGYNFMLTSSGASSGSGSGSSSSGGEYIIDTRIHDLPITFDELTVRNRLKTWGIETSYLYRGHAGSHGGIFELYLGARYLQLYDRFSVEGTGDKFLRLESEDSSSSSSGSNNSDSGDSEENLGTPIAPGTILADSFWYGNAENHIIGPQIGLHWFRQTERWTWESDARFFAGFNIQDLEQGGSLGSELNEPFTTSGSADDSEEDVTWPAYTPFQPLYMRNETFNYSKTEHEFSPGVEFRLNLKYQLTRAAALRVGWSGMWIDGIARGANLINYDLTETQYMGIDLKDNRQSVFMHGVTFGVDFNR